MLLALVSLVLAAVFLLWFFGRRPYWHRGIAPLELKTYLEVLLRRGYPDGFMMIELPGKDIFLQFVKYGQSSSAGLRCDFPMAPWSREFYPQVEELGKNMGVALSEREADQPDGMVTAFLQVGFGRDVSGAAQFAHSFFSDIAGFPQMTVDLYFRGVSPKDEII